MIAMMGMLWTSPADAAIQRAVAYLSREVPAWSPENKCFSCHNNGDAARALYVARSRGVEVPDAALADTSAWLVDVSRWDKNGGQGPFNDLKLARLQFAATLASAAQAKAMDNSDALQKAAELLSALQDADGSWQVEQSVVGSPASYGTPLATVMARQVLVLADAKRHAKNIHDADQWLGKREAKTVSEAAALLLWADEGKPADAWLNLIRRGQAANGGWGPYVNSPPEPFDSALVLLGLTRHRKLPGVEDLIRQGRTYLLATQLDDGSWPETTRPPGGVSYAQKLSTTGWALRALLESAQPESERR